MSFEDMCLEKAEQGDGNFAIAYALSKIATQVKYLGVGNAASSMGAIEYLASHLGEKIDGLSSSIRQAIELNNGD